MGDNRFQPVLADHVPALTQRVDVAEHASRLCHGLARQAHELELDGEEMFADDVQTALRQQAVHVGDPTGRGVVDRDHGGVGQPGRDSRKALFKRPAGDRLDRAAPVILQNCRV